MASLLADDSVRSQIEAAYVDVRDDSTETRWCTISYATDKTVELSGSGTEYSEFLGLLENDSRVYGYVRFQTGDEMSRRAKFAFITWIGPGVPVLKKARVSTDKAFIKKIFNEFSKEILADDRSEVNEARIKATIIAASGAAYGTGR